MNQQNPNQQIFYAHMKDFIGCVNQLLYDHAKNNGKPITRKHVEESGLTELLRGFHGAYKMDAQSAVYYFDFLCTNRTQADVNRIKHILSVIYSQLALEKPVQKTRTKFMQIIGNRPYFNLLANINISEDSLCEACRKTRETMNAHPGAAINKPVLLKGRIKRKTEHTPRTVANRLIINDAALTNNNANVQQNINNHHQ